MFYQQNSAFIKILSGLFCFTFAVSQHDFALICFNRLVNTYCFGLTAQLIIAIIKIEIEILYIFILTRIMPFSTAHDVNVVNDVVCKEGKGWDRKYSRKQIKSMKA